MSIPRVASPEIVFLPSAEGGISEQVYLRLLTGIARREYRPGRPMDERGLADAMLVSRTPLRSALSRLLGEGYLERRPNGSLAVREIGAGEVLELLGVRRLLEPDAAGRAAGHVPIEEALALRGRLRDVGLDPPGAEAWRLGDEVHDLVVAQCGNQSLARIVVDARRRIHMSALEAAPGRIGTARDEHLAILDALLSGDSDAASAAMTHHLDRSRDSFLASRGGAR